MGKTLLETVGGAVMMVECAHAAITAAIASRAMSLARHRHAYPNRDHAPTASLQATGDVKTCTQTPPSSGPLVAVVVLYLATGVLQPTLVDWVKYCGAAGMKHPPAMLTLLSNTAGMALAAPSAWLVLRMRCLPTGFRQQLAVAAGCQSALAVLPDTGALTTAVPRAEVNTLSAWRGPVTRSLWMFRRLCDRRVVVASSIDLCSGLLVMIGLLSVGSGMYVIIYSSCTAWTAVISRVFLGKRLHPLQAIGVVLCTLGLCANGLASALHVEETALVDTEDHPATRAFHGQTRGAVVVGALAVLAGSILHSGMFVLVEKGAASRGMRDEIAPLDMCSRMGCVESGVVACWVAGLVMAFSPAEVLVAPQLAAHNTTLWYAGMLYAALTAANMLHALSFFVLIGQLGATGSSVLKGLHAVLVFCFSALFYCRFQSSQCATPLKVCAMALVLAGTIVYSRGKPQGHPAAPNSRSSEATDSAA